MIEAAQQFGLLSEPSPAAPATPGASATPVAITSTAQPLLPALDFLSLKAYSDALVANGFDVPEEVRIYLEIARDRAVKARDRLMALRYLRNALVQVAMMHGAVRQTTVKLSPGGASLSVTGGSVNPIRNPLVPILLDAAQIVDAIPEHMEQKYVEATEGEITDIHGGLSRRAGAGARRFDPTIAISEPADRHPIGQDAGEPDTDRETLRDSSGAGATGTAPAPDGDD